MLDFVDIATPPRDHALVAHAAFEHGLDVLCETPLALVVADVESLIDHAMRARRVLFPCHPYKHAPVLKVVRTLLEREQIGIPHLVTFQLFRETHPRGAAGFHPEWRRERRYSGGGVGMDDGSHALYLAFDWLRSYPTSISARAESAQALDTEDDFICSVRFPTGVATVHLSWTAGVPKAMYTIHGDLGAISVEDDRIEIAKAISSEGKTGWEFERRVVPSRWGDRCHPDWFVTLLDDFVTAIEIGGTWLGRKRGMHWLACS